MSETTINQRLIFLLESLKMKAPAFARTIGVGETTFRNYIDRDSKPSSEVLEKILNSFENVNIVWLVTGRGEPFTSEVPSVANTTTTRIKKVTGGAVHSGNGNQLITLEACQQELENTKRDMATAQKEIALLTSQLADKERTIQILLKQGS
jgi:hypothetical protein